MAWGSDFWLWVSGFGFRVSGVGFRVADLGFRVSGFGLRVSGFGSRVSGFGFRVSGVEFRVLGFGFQVSGLGFRVSGFGFQVSDFGFRVSDFEFRVLAPPRAPRTFSRSHFTRISKFGFELRFRSLVSGFFFRGLVSGLGFRDSGLSTPASAPSEDATPHTCPRVWVSGLRERRDRDNRLRAQSPYTTILERHRALGIRLL